MRPIAEPRHVIFVCVDSLRADRLRPAGYLADCCPTLNHLAQTGVLLTNVSSHGNPTQFSYPAVMSSTLPLDSGGYDEGIKRRQTALAEVFRGQGFRTAGFSPSPWLGRLHGYDRGFDDFYQLFNVAVFWMLPSKLYCPFYRRLLEDGQITQDEHTRTIGAFLSDTLDFLLDHYRERRWEVDGGEPIVADDALGPRPAYVTGRLEEERQAIQADPEGYLERRRDALLAMDFDAFLASQGATPPKEAPRGDSAVESRFWGPRFAGALGKILRPDALPPPMSNALVLESLLRWLDHCHDRRSFAWVHFLDLHDRSFSLRHVRHAFNPLTLARSYRRHGASALWHVAYDLSLRHNDNTVKALLDFLRSRRMLDDTLLVIFGDHGTDIGVDGKRAGDQAENDLRVPVMFWGKEIEQRTVDGLSGLIDLAPSLCDLMGFPSVPGFKGLSVFSKDLASRDHIVLENLGPGPGDLRHKRIQIGIKSGTWKLTAREDDSVSDTPGLCDIKLYDLGNDPSEQQNLWDGESSSGVGRRLLEIARARCRELREAHPAAQHAAG